MAPHPAGSEEPFTLGVEEEYQIINPATRGLRARGKRVLNAAQEAVGEEVQPELRLSQIETATPVCATLAEARAELVRLRRAVIEAATRDGDQIAAAGTHPFSQPEDQPFTAKERYQQIAADYQQIARELVIFGCHVHVGLADPELGIQVMNRARVWLAPLLALAANSPFWVGEDTGYASFRTEIWTRWPMAGQPQVFASREEYDELIRTLIAAGVIQDETRIYWDIRLPARIPTVEFRVTDVCLTIDDTLMVTGLTRGVVRTCYEQAQRGEPFPAARPELLRAAHWRAARYGLFSELIDVSAGRSVPAAELIESLLEFARPGLEAAGDWDEVSQQVRATLKHGNGASRQRDVYQRAGRLEDVVDYIVQETARGTGAAVATA